MSEVGADMASVLGDFSSEILGQPVIWQVKATQNALLLRVNVVASMLVLSRDGTWW